MFETNRLLIRNFVTEDTHSCLEGWGKDKKLGKYILGYPEVKEMAANKYEGTQTEKNLQEAFAGESQARNKYTYFASVAKKEGYEQMSALFLKTADNENSERNAQCADAAACGIFYRSGVGGHGL